MNGQLKPKQLTKESLLTLPIETAQPLGTIEGRDGHEFTLFVGLSSGHLEQLKEYSLDVSDEAIQLHTSDRKRFGEGSYEEWYNNSRTPFSLVDKETNELAAFIWFGPKPLGAKSLKHVSSDEHAEILNTDPGTWHTVAYRAYGKYRGVGIMKKFVNAATEAYLHAYTDARIWAIVDGKDAASLGLAKALGYEELEEEGDGFVLMVRG